MIKNVFFAMLGYIDLYFPGSSSGRTPRSGRGNWGSNPYPGVKFNRVLRF